MADLASRKQRTLLAPVPLGKKEQFERWKKAYDWFIRKASTDLPATLDFPGSPLGPAVGMGIGALGIMKTTGKLIGDPSRVLNLFKSFSKTKNPSGAATSFGYAFRKSPRMKEILEESGRVIKEDFKKAPLYSDERGELAFVGQLLREASEEAWGVVPEKFSYAAQRAKRKALGGASEIKRRGK